MNRDGREGSGAERDAVRLSASAEERRACRTPAPVASSSPSRPPPSLSESKTDLHQHQNHNHPLLSMALFIVVVGTSRPDDHNLQPRDRRRCACCFLACWCVDGCRSCFLVGLLIVLIRCCFSGLVRWTCGQPASISIVSFFILSWSSSSLPSSFSSWSSSLSLLSSSVFGLESTLLPVLRRKRGVSGRWWLRLFVFPSLLSPPLLRSLRRPPSLLQGWQTGG